MSTQQIRTGRSAVPRAGGGEQHRRRSALGEFGERLAAAHLAAEGHVLLARNWRCRYGEIDLVARDDATLVFCEVKTRRTDRFGPPSAAVGAGKASRIRELAVRWMTATGTHGGEIRFDVISVLSPVHAPVRLEHLRSAF
ncbi:YraN family protein [Actinocatenispora rupis]|uniref:UPF0102 protein Aru02nite_00110 n=1 Tax=Actinocatenispora rupis TaxID=519421 RepID=A0A8J3IZA8_9ACTN|nr:YraN family protein [Actinocatenispora rupis]GID09122.1 UPF0102 protein [Actinocatenispora rupis]